MLERHPLGDRLLFPLGGGLFAGLGDTFAAQKAPEACVLGGFPAPVYGIMVTATGSTPDTGEPNRYQQANRIASVGR